MDWIDANQLGRRNLTPDQMSYIRGRLYNRRKKAVTNPKGLGGKSGKIDESQSDTHQKDTATAIATAHGVSRATVIRDGKREGGNGGVYGRQPKGGHCIPNCIPR